MDAFGNLDFTENPGRINNNKKFSSKRGSATTEPTRKYRRRKKKKPRHKDPIRTTLDHLLPIRTALDRFSYRNSDASTNGDVNVDNNEVVYGFDLPNVHRGVQQHNSYRSGIQKLHNSGSHNKRNPLSTGEKET